MIRNITVNEKKAEQQDKIINELLRISKEESKYKTDEEEFEALISQLELISEEDTELSAVIIPKIKHVIANIVLYCRNDEDTILNLLKLIEQKVPTSIQNTRDTGHTSLVYTALTHRHFRLIKELVNTYGYDIDTADSRNNTALSLIVTSPSREDIKLSFIQFLLNLGADPSRIVEKDLTSIELARTHKVRELLLSSEKAAHLHEAYANKPPLPETGVKIISTPKTAQKSNPNGFLSSLSIYATSFNQFFSKQSSEYQKISTTDEKSWQQENTGKSYQRS